MAFNFSPKIVTDGLIAYFDAANPKSIISGSGETIWRDLSKNQYNATNYNSYTYVNEYGGGIRLDGTNQYFVYNAPLSAALTVITIGRSNQALWDFSGTLTSARTTNGFIIHNWRNDTFISGYVAPGYLQITPGYLGAAQGNIQVPIFSALTTNGTNVHRMYYNGISTGLDTSSQSRSATTFGNVYLGYDWPNARFGNITLYIHMLYNRELSADEIRQIYNATKSRFNLP